MMSLRDGGRLGCADDDNVDWIQFRQSRLVTGRLAAKSFNVVSELQVINSAYYVCIMSHAYCRLLPIHIYIYISPHAHTLYYLLCISSSPYPAFNFWRLVNSFMQSERATNYVLLILHQMRAEIIYILSFCDGGKYKAKNIHA